MSSFMDEQDKQLLTDAVHKLYDEYKHDEYMKQKVISYINVQLPNIFTNMNETHIQRVARIEELSTEQELFMQSFLNSNQYFYVANTSNFFTYDGIHYQIHSEEDILHHVLSTISKDGYLMSWKHKTKVGIMKRIKDNYLLNSIPESETIQNVLSSLSTTLFRSRSHAKYFLCILGDNLLKKNTQLIHFINPYAKHFIRHLNNLSNMLIGLNLSQTFKHKYHDHDYNNFRIVNINYNVKHEHTWNNILNTQMIDILCVACHYSNRYLSSDEYIETNCNNEELRNNIFAVKNTSPEELVKEFVSEYIDIISHQNSPAQSFLMTTMEGSSRITQITWKNMEYLWKLFLDDKNIPSIIFMNQLKTMIIEKLNNYYNEQTDTFSGVCSKYLPSIQRFLQFWNDTIRFDDSETDMEVEELIILFKKWCELNNEICGTVNDKKILDLIYYYYPQLEIEKDKFISGIRCTLWDKQMDIQVAIENMKDNICNKHGNDNSHTIPTNVSIYDMYLYYCKFVSNASNVNLSTLTSYQKQIVSKTYFEKYIYDNYSEFIIDNKFLQHGWYMK
jgi:hypothetical protein